MADPRIAVITGVPDQDGFHLAEQPQGEGHRLLGIVSCSGGR